MDQLPIARGAIAALEAHIRGSVAELRGSLAAGVAVDRYSDIDLRWTVPDEAFDRSVASVKQAFLPLGSVLSLRSDPDYQRSLKRRLLFIRLAGLPLFWRIDLDVFAASVAHDPNFDSENPEARGDAWSKSESALMNAVASVKALGRGRPALADELLQRGYERVALTRDPETIWTDQIRDLADGVVRVDGSVTELAQEVIDLAVDELDS